MCGTLDATSKGSAMDELRVVRREDGALIVATELGEEYKLTIDDAFLAEVRQATKRTPSPSTVRPREIQSLLRSGKSRLEVAVEVGLEEEDVERFEEPVRAEQRYILELAHAVPVRTDPQQGHDSPLVEQRFGEVIADRLVSLRNTTNEWRSWREEESGWFVGLAFDSVDGEHDAVWSFDHRKRVLTPVSADATNLSKLGEVGDRLIPKLRVVDSEPSERFDSDAFDPDALLAETAEHERPPATAAEEPPVDADAEYARRREIDHFAVKTSDDAGADLSQTADLLDALRRRRGERAQGTSSEDHGSTPLPFDVDRLADDFVDEVRGDTSTQAGAPTANDSNANQAATPQSKPRISIARNIWGASGVSAAEEPAPLRAVDQGASDSSNDGESPDRAQSEQKSSKRGRSSIPSWDDILFGTRSDDDPA